MSASKRATLRSTQHALLASAGIRCTGCRALCEEYIVETDIIAAPAWKGAVRTAGGWLEMEGILHSLGPAFEAVFQKTSFGYGANAAGTCPQCARQWRYRADYHFGMFDGLLACAL